MRRENDTCPCALRKLCGPWASTKIFPLLYNYYGGFGELGEAMIDGGAHQGGPKGRGSLFRNHMRTLGASIIGSQEDDNNDDAVNTAEEKKKRGPYTFQIRKPLEKDRDKALELYNLLVKGEDVPKKGKTTRISRRVMLYVLHGS